MRTTIKSLVLLALLSGSAVSLGGGRKNARPFQVTTKIYYAIVNDFNITYDGKKVNFLVVGLKMKPYLDNALNCLREADARDAFKTYHGAINQRMIRGTNRKSHHWRGHAIDINAFQKQPPILVKCFEEAGFKWGGRWEDAYDPMHFELPHLTNEEGEKNE